MSILWLQMIFLGCGCFVQCSMIDELIEELESVIVNAKGEVSPPSDYPPQYNPCEGLQTPRRCVLFLFYLFSYPGNRDPKKEEFDMVVVGGGSAGCVLANRLTEGEGEGGDRRVLLLEAGGDPPPDAEVPALYGTLQMSPVDWNFTTEPQEDVFLSHVDGSCRWPRGKALGGSSVINYMWYARGNSRDYDEWGEGWRYEQVLPYFKKSEDLRASSVLRTEDALKYHSTGGELTVEDWVNAGNPLVQIFRKGFQEIGLPFNPDYNGKIQSGFTWLVGTLRDHRRCHHAKAFLTPAKDRENLKVSKNSLVTKILIDNITSTAYGVEFINPHGNTVRVRAKKEVVLSAGAINSPQILMLSGIGPKEHLRDLNIPLVKDLPVGQNLQDHPNQIFVLKFNKSPFECYNMNNPLDTIKNTFEFLLRGKSSLSTMNGFQCAAYINSSCTTGFPYLSTGYIYFEKNQSSAVRATFIAASYNDEVIDQVVKLNEDYFIVVWGVFLLRPYSKGSILLKDTNPKTHPRIQPGYFTDPRDMQMLLEAFDVFEKLNATMEFQSSGASFYDIKIAACDCLRNSTNEYRECLIRHLVMTTYHPSCTCGMGRVVDSSLKVKGVNRLRVVDASVFPRVPSANTNAPVTMVAEKACDIIKQSCL